MWPYFAMFGVMSVLLFVEVFNRADSLTRKLVFYIAFILLVFFAGIRQPGVGADDLVYVERFLATPNYLDWLIGSFRYSYYDSGGMEVGFVFFMSVLRLITDNPSAIIFFSALFSVGLTLTFYKKYSCLISLSSLLFFSHTYLYRDMNQIRSAIAAAFVLTVFHFMTQKKYTHAILSLFIAGLFHFAAMFVLLGVLLFICFPSRPKLFVLISIIASVALGKLNISTSIASGFQSLSFVANKINDYSGDYYISTVQLFDITNIKGVAFVLLLTFLYDKLITVSPFFRVAYFFYFFGVFLRVAFYDLGVMIARVSTFFTVGEVILLSFVFCAFRQKKIVVWIIWCYGLTQLLLNIYFTEGRYPYSISNYL